MSRTLQEIVREHRMEIITRIASTARELILHPDLTSRVANNSKIEDVVNALGDELKAYEAVVVAHHTSSHQMYALRDLPQAEAEEHQSATHCIRTLKSIYGPQVAEG